MTLAGAHHWDPVPFAARHGSRSLLEADAGQGSVCMTALSRAATLPGRMDGCPARLDESVSSRAIEVALRAHRSLGCQNVSRVDIIIDEAGVPQVLELNISPGMTETSLLPMAAESAGLDFNELVRLLVKLAMEKYS